MSNHDRNAGLLAGGCGVVALVACSLATELPFLLSLVVAAVVCVAVMLIAPGGPLAPRTKPTEAQAKAMAAVRTKIAGVKSAADQVGQYSRRGKTLLDSCVEKMTRIIAVIEEDRNKFASAEPFLQDISPLCDEFVPLYTKLIVRQVKTAAETIREAEERQLPRLIARFDNLYERLHSFDAAWLETGNEITLPKIGDVDLKLEGGQP